MGRFDVGGGSAAFLSAGIGFILIGAVIAAALGH